MEETPKFNNKKYLIIASAEVLFVVFGLLFAINDTSSNSSLGAGLWAVWFIIIGIPATGITWLLNYLSYKKQLKSGKPVVIDPNWRHKQHRGLLIIFILLFVLPAIYDGIVLLVQVYSGN